MISAWCAITGYLFRTQKCDSPTAPTSRSGSAGRKGLARRSSLRAASRCRRAASEVAIRTTNGMPPSRAGNVSVSIGSSAPASSAVLERRAIAAHRSPRATWAEPPSRACGSAIEQVPARERAERAHLVAHPLRVAAELGGEQARRARRDLARGAPIEQQCARAAREHVFQGARHFVARAEYDLRTRVGQARVQR